MFTWINIKNIYLLHPLSNLSVFIILLFKYYFEEIEVVDASNYSDLFIYKLGGPKVGLKLVCLNILVFIIISTKFKFFNRNPELKTNNNYLEIVVTKTILAVHTFEPPYV